MNQRIKRHHIVPKVLQRRFAIDDDSTRVWRSKRVQNATFPSPHKKRIDQAFMTLDYNTFTVDGKRHDDIERIYYGGIDDFLGRFIPKVLDYIDNNQTPSLDASTLFDVRRVVLEMVKRSPEFTIYSDEERGRKYVKRAISELPCTEKDDERQRLTAEQQDRDKLNEYGRNIRVIETIEDRQIVNDALSEFSVRWAVSKTEYSFILSSLMVYRIGNGGHNGFNNPMMEMWFPISPKVCMVLVRDPYNKIPAIVLETPQNIRRLNEFAIANSNEIASHCETLLRSLLNN